jgi:hypothetical protein
MSFCPFWPDIAGPFAQKVLFSSYSTGWDNFVAIYLMLKSSVKIKYIALYVQ